MKLRKLVLTGLALSSLAGGASMSAVTQAAELKPNIMFIMADDVGWMQPSIYH
ncbi:hypothetical protein [Pseudomonas koreensis]|uniref:hypothetical protein n=1 Tax=Pseudomonas koreensis TaxID=198620 RepID=UPI0032079A0F